MLTGAPLARATTPWTSCMPVPPERRCSHPRGNVRAERGRAPGNFPTLRGVADDMTLSLGRRSAAGALLTGLLASPFLAATGPSYAAPPCPAPPVGARSRTVFPL